MLNPCLVCPCVNRVLSDHCVLSVRYPCVIRALNVQYPCLNRALSVHRQMTNFPYYYIVNTCSRDRAVLMGSNKTLSITECSLHLNLDIFREIRKDKKVKSLPTPSQSAEETNQHKEYRSKDSI